MPIVQPLGVFGPTRQSGIALRRETLEPLRDRVSPQLRKDVSRYLESGVVILALMEYTKDVLGEKFGVSGGSGIFTDGNFYWRRDAADYVAAYGIEIPPWSIELMIEQDWKMPRLEPQRVMEIDSYLYQELKSR